MRTIQHWIDGAETRGSSTRTGPVFNPATGEQQAEVLLAEQSRRRPRGGRRGRRLPGVVADPR